MCSGWDAGGPWITDDTAAHHYVQAHLVLKGPQTFSGKLPQPPGNITGYHDVAVQAFRKPDGVETTSGPRPKMTASSAQQKYPAAMASDDDEHTMWVSDGWKPGDAPTPQRPEWLQLAFPQPIETETLWIVPKSPYGPKEIAIQTSTDGKTFVTVEKHALRRDGEAIVPLPPTRTSILRVQVTASYAAENTQIAEVALQQPIGKVRQHALAIKSGRASVRDMGSVRAGVEAPLGPPPFDPEVAALDPAGIVDLTDKLAEARWFGTYRKANGSFYAPATPPPAARSVAALGAGTGLRWTGLMLARWTITSNRWPTYC